MRLRSSSRVVRTPRCSSPRPVHRFARVCSTRLPPRPPSSSTSSKPFSETRRYPKEKYFFFSAFPMEGRAQGVCERGSYYELTDAELTASYPLGVSNEYAAGSDCITISTRSGALVVVETIAD